MSFELWFSKVTKQPIYGKIDFLSKSWCQELKTIAFNMIQGKALSISKRFEFYCFYAFWTPNKAVGDQIFANFCIMIMNKTQPNLTQPNQNYDSSCF